MKFPWHLDAPISQLATLRDVSLARVVREHVQGKIFRGDLTAGERIIEPAIAAELGISRVPVREALRELESTGLVVSRKHSGVYVREPDGEEIASLYAMRGLLDGFAGRIVAGKPKAARTAIADALDASIVSMKAFSAEREVRAYYGENLRFHWIIIEAADNSVLAANYKDIVQKLHVSRLKNLSQNTGIRVSIAEHVKIAASIRRGDVPGSESLMSHHVGDAYRRLLTHAE